MMGCWGSDGPALRLAENKFDMVRLNFREEEAEPRVLRRRSWLGVEAAGSSADVRAVAGGETVFVE